MKISIIDTLCPGNSLQEKLHLLEKLGIEGIELETALSGILQEKRACVLDELSNSKVKLSTMLLGYQSSLLSRSKEIRERAADKIKKYMKVCAELEGIGIVTVPSSRKKRSPFNFFLNSKEETKKQLAVAQYRNLGKYAQELGVYIIIEPIDHLHTDFINTCDEAVEICRKTGSDRVKICPDLFHMSIEEPNINEKIKEFSEYIVHLHIGDNDRKSRFAVSPGKGNLDFVRIFGTLKNIKYPDYLSLDCRILNEEELRWSVQSLRKLML